MSSLIFLGFSVILFIISYGVMFTIAPMILGSVFTVMENNLTNGSMTQEWIDMYNQTKETTQYLIPLIPSIGIFILVIKVLMVASARGRD
jgi:putative exporter of polyketide antibiotics|uniref:ORF13 n=1 Tax=Nitrosopumilaceae spindle-shaped virus TaxID=3065433 RepID=A0AAT9JAA5_9VIRU